MKSHSRRVRRPRNPDIQQKKKSPFFSNAVQAKEDPYVQAKLTVGQAGDQYEQQADKAAANVQKMDATTKEEEKPSVQMEAIKEEDKGIQKKEEPEKLEEDKSIQKQDMKEEDKMNDKK